VKTTLEYLEAEAKLRSLRDATVEQLNAFDAVGNFTKLTPEQVEFRDGLKGEFETFKLCLGLIGEEIDRRDKAEGCDPSKPLAKVPGYGGGRRLPVGVRADGIETPDPHRVDRPHHDADADRYAKPDTTRAQLARGVGMTTWVANHGSEEEWHDYNRLVDSHRG
jgi:hypothetical protein